MITRCGTPTNTGNLLRIVSNRILELGGNVRTARVLGDRILTKQLVGKDKAKHIIGRYVSVIYDGNPKYYPSIVGAAQLSFEMLRISQFRVKDFISEATNMVQSLEEAPFIKNSKIESREYARAIEVLREQQQKL